MKWLSVLGAVFLAVFSCLAQTTNGLSVAEVEGRQLAQEILQQNPTGDLTNTGILEIRSAQGERTKIPLRFQIVVNEYDAPVWSSIYQTVTTNEGVKLSILHSLAAGHDTYHLCKDNQQTDLSESETMAPFAGSDFWICDLGLEFFHWPDQKIIKHETRRTRACAVLESSNPNPAAGNYSKVDTWVDDETQRPVHAEAYDAKGKLLKVFDPKSFKKVNGHWELEDMEIRNVQTGSRTVIRFDLNSRT
jgi:hypothetical protein